MRLFLIGINLGDKLITSEEAEYIEERLRELFTELKLDTTIESVVTGNTVAVDSYNEIIMDDRLWGKEQEP